MKSQKSISSEDDTQEFKNNVQKSPTSPSFKDVYNHHFESFDKKNVNSENDSDDEVDRLALANCWTAGLPSKKIEFDLESTSSDDSVQFKDNLLLAKCLAAGLPQCHSSYLEEDCSHSDESNSVNDRFLIAKCFLAGLPPRKTCKKPNSVDLSEVENDPIRDRYLIAKCLFAGLPKKPR